ncbi:MAG: glycerol-3-phosphate 1-O-acyltransferase PlsY [Deltaproteobacteria bacterium]|nr:glycerol-3-phosphate 1-O-acyltransferase PlsY [Deltaproteobacteria bacterium]
MEPTPVIIAAFAIFAYLLGSIPFGLVVVKMLGGVDPRTSGSGNIGATNVGRTSGKKAGILTLLFDAMKGALPPLIAKLTVNDPTTIAIAALAAFLGHLYPVYLRFKGGKGVATACGAMAAVAPIPLGIGAVTFAVLLATTRYVSAGSMGAAMANAAALYVLGYDTPYAVLGAVMAVLIIVKHRENIKRLMNNSENKFGAGKKA